MNQVINKIVSDYGFLQPDGFISEVVAPQLNMVLKEEQIFMREDGDFIPDYAEYIHHYSKKKISLKFAQEIAEYLW